MGNAVNNVTNSYASTFLARPPDKHQPMKSSIDISHAKKRGSSFMCALSSSGPGNETTGRLIAERFEEGDSASEFSLCGRDYVLCVMQRSVLIITMPERSTVQRKEVEQQNVSGLDKKWCVACQRPGKGLLQGDCAEVVRK